MFEPRNAMHSLLDTSNCICSRFLSCRALSSPKSSGYESDSNYIMRKRTETDSVSGVRTPDLPPLSPAEQKHMYAEIQKGGEVPLQGLRKFVPGPGPRDPMFDDQDGFRTGKQAVQIYTNCRNVKPAIIEIKTNVCSFAIPKYSILRIDRKHSLSITCPD